MNEELSVIPPPLVGERLIGASCSLGAAEMKERLASWRALRDRATDVQPITGGVRLGLAPDEGLDEVARLVALESACCAFYDFALRVGGTSRELKISAGPDGTAAVHALLGLELPD
jgi:MerR family transcriptional regulator, copper efflux regulator